MALILFLSAVSDEFHKPDPRRPRAFASYRDVLTRALRRAGTHFHVIVQEELAQGMGDLLATLEREVASSNVVIHLVGELCGFCPEPAAIRRLQERHPQLLAHEPELAQSLADLKEISYTQWELLFAFEHRKNKLVYLASPQAPRSPQFRRNSRESAIQKSHFQRISITGEHFDTFADQHDLALKVLADVIRCGLLADSQASAPTEEAIARAQAAPSELVTEISDVLRSEARNSRSPEESGGIDAFLKALDTVALKRELDRRTALEVVHQQRDAARLQVEQAPTPENWRERALVELALGHYPDAMQAAQRSADAALTQPWATSNERRQQRSTALNAFLLLHEAAKLAGNRQTALEALLAGGRQIDSAEDPLLWASYHEEIAEELMNQARFAEAQDLIDQILDLREEVQGDEHPDLVRPLYIWTQLLTERAKYQGSIDVAARAERILRKTSPIDWNSVASFLAVRAWALKELGQFAEAESLMRIALEIEEQSVGTAHPRVAACLNDLALLLLETHRLVEAEPLLRRALAIDEQSVGLEHPTIAKRLNNLASLLLETHRLAEAEPLLRRALAIDEQSFGPEHPRVSTTINNLAILLHETNQLAEAELLMRRALANDEVSFGPEHPTVAINLSNLAKLLLETNRLAEAEPLMRRALAIDEQSFGPEHHTVASRLSNLASLLQDTNRLAEAEPLMRRALAIDEQSLGLEHPTVAIRLNNLALLLRETNRLAEAEPLMRRALAIDEQSFGLEHPTVATRLSNLAVLLQETNRLAEAETLKRQALTIREQLFSPEHPAVAISLNNLATLLKETYRVAEAEPLMRRALAIYEKSFGPEHPDVASCLSNLAELLREMDRVAEAEPLIRQALAINEKSYGPEHPTLAIPLNNLALLLRETNRLAEAEPLMQRALRILDSSYGGDHPETIAIRQKLASLLEELKPS